MVNNGRAEQTTGCFGQGDRLRSRSPVAVASIGSDSGRRTGRAAIAVATRTRLSLRVQAELDQRIYPLDVRVSDRSSLRCPLQRHD